MFIRTVTILMYVLNTACNRSAPPSNDEEVVKKIVFDIIDADNRSQIEKVLSFYDSAAVLMPPGKSIISGVGPIRANYEQIFATSRLSLKTEVETVKLTGDMGYAIGRNTGTVLILKDSTTRQIDSKYIMILEKKGDKIWKIKRLIWNDNK